MFLNFTPQLTGLQPVFADAETEVLYMIDDYEHMVNPDEEGATEAAEIRCAVAAAARRARLVLATNRTLAARFEAMGKPTAVFRCAVDLEPFEQARRRPAPMPESLCGINRPIIGYIGAIDPRTDIELLRYLAEKRPQWNIVLLGPTPKPSLIPDSLRRHANVHFLPAVPYEQLPVYLSFFDVAIAPYLVNDCTRGIDPKRIYDYLAASLPVVVSNVGGVDVHGDLIHVAHSYNEFLALTETSLRDNSPALAEKRHRYAALNTADHRAKQFLQLLASLPRSRP